MARREYSRCELYEKLLTKGCSEAIARSVSDGLVAEGLLSDERFIQSLIRVRRGRGYGPLRIRVELQEKGIAPEIVDDAVAARSREWVDEIKRVRRKKFGASLPATYAERARQARFLQSRGFSTDQIFEVLKGREDD